MICKNCGTEIKVGFFCPKCGTKNIEDFNDDSMTGKSTSEQNITNDNILYEIEMEKQKTEQERLAVEKAKHEAELAKAQIEQEKLNEKKKRRRKISN